MAEEISYVYSRSGITQAILGYAVLFALGAYVGYATLETIDPFAIFYAADHSASPPVPLITNPGLAIGGLFANGFSGAALAGAGTQLLFGTWFGQTMGSKHAIQAKALISVAASVFAVAAAWDVWDSPGLADSSAIQEIREAANAIVLLGGAAALALQGGIGLVTSGYRRLRYDADSPPTTTLYL